MNDTAILITAYTGGNDPSFHSCGDEAAVKRKEHMAKTLTKYLKQSGYYVCMSSHSILDIETQSYCHSYIYDSDNSWQINGLPRRPNHGVAELTAIHNGINLLEGKGFKNILKLCYDQHPDLDYPKLIENYKSLNKKLVTFQTPYDLATMCFFSDIQFFKETFGLNEVYRAEYALERAWLESVREKGRMEEVFGYSTYREMLELKDSDPDHFASMQGNTLYAYNY
jgi:hypothetical protein